MQIADGTVVYFHYTLTNADGDVLDASAVDAPLGYLHGAGNIISGLESALTGRRTGDRFEVTVAPEDAYGVRDESLVQSVPRSAFEGIAQLAPGMRFESRSESGDAQVVTVTEVGDGSVTIDGNHPLAGQSLTFVVEVTEVRAATAQEQAHGHLHEHGHDH